MTTLRHIDYATATGDNTDELDERVREFLRTVAEAEEDWVVHGSPVISNHGGRPMFIQAMVQIESVPW